MNRTQRLRRLATKKGMAQAARVQARRRGNDHEHRYVVGTFFLEAGRVVLWAVECGPAYDLPRPPRLTNEARHFNRWRTRQAADQFSKRWHLDTHVIDLGYLDVLPQPGALTGKQSGRRVYFSSQVGSTSGT